jgi:drug/metabolite transporter (DMT)-like permease
MKTSEPLFNDRREMMWGIGTVSVWILSYFGARVLLKSFEMGTWLRVFVAIAPIIPFAFLLLGIIRGIRQMDELERRIQLEALGVAFPLTFLLLMTLGLLELAIRLKPEDWSYRHLWPFMVVFYLIGLILAKRRYQ